MKQFLKMEQYIATLLKMEEGYRDKKLALRNGLVLSQYCAKVITIWKFCCNMKHI